MRISSPLIALLGLLALVAAACGTGNPAHAAEVDGETIPVSAVESRYETVANNPQFADQLRNDPDGTLTTQVQAEILTELIQARLWEQGAAELGIELTDEDVAERREQLVEEVGGQEQFDELLEQSGLSEADLQAEIRNLAVRERVQEHLTADIEVSDAEVEEFYEAQREQRYEQVEARHILLETEDEAHDVIERIDDGESFADLARDLSIDPGSGAEGGDLGAFGRGQMVPEFEEAAFDVEIGEVTGPVESQFGFHVIEVTGRIDQELAEVEDDIRDELSQEQAGGAMGEWFGELLRAADVTVNPRFGEWDAERGQVVPTAALDEVDGELPVEPAPDPDLPGDDDVEIDPDE